MSQASNMLPPGAKYCQCPACGEYFTNETNFDMHRQDSRREPGLRVCVPPVELRRKDGKSRLKLNSRGYWTRADGVYRP